MSATQGVRHVRLFKNGRSQAVRIPREFEMPGDEAVMHKDESGRLILEPIPRPKLLDLLSSWTPLDKKDHLPPIEDRRPEPVKM